MAVSNTMSQGTQTVEPFFPEQALLETKVHTLIEEALQVQQSALIPLESSSVLRRFSPEETTVFCIKSLKIIQKLSDALKEVIATPPKTSYEPTKLQLNLLEKRLQESFSRSTRTPPNSPRE